MAPRKEVKSLTVLSLEAFSVFVEKVVVEKSFQIVRLDQLFYKGHKTNSSLFDDYFTKFDFRQEAVDHFVNIFRDFILCQVVQDVFEDVIHQILIGIKNACDNRRLAWKAEDDASGIFANEMSTIVDFTQVIVSPRLRHLDLSEIVKILRSRLFDLLPGFTGLLTLRCGSGSGGVSNIYSGKFLAGVNFLKHLVHFSLQYDCNDTIVSVLRRNCHNSLRILDVEYSTRVTDNSVQDILKCQYLVQIHLFHTGITPCGHADLLRGLKHLRRLVRGDYLCEALEVLEQTTNGVLPKLNIEEFWSSEDYYFHDAQQMALVSRACPYMRKIMFQFNPEFVTDFMVLAPFQNLTELHNWGGDFYSNRLNDLICMIGHRLNVLYLIHVDEIDHMALGLISRMCKRIQTLGFYNCIFREIFGVQDQHHFQIVHPSLVPMLELKKLAIVSSCGPGYVIELVSSALNVQHLITGLSTDFNEYCLNQILLHNRLSRLEELKVSKSSDITISTVHYLVEQCPCLNIVRDMEYWDNISNQDLFKFREFLRKSNLNVLTEDPANFISLLSRGDVARKATSYWSRSLQSLQAE